MRRIVLALMGTLTAVILLFGYRTSTGGTASAAPLTSQSTTKTNTPTVSSTASAAAGSSGAGSGGSGGTTGSATTTSKTYDGAVTGTRWGDVQVQITVVAGKITAAITLETPSGNGRDQEINSYAVPILNQEVITAQSASIDTISGATVTSDGYIGSLQSALDKASL